MHLEDAGIYKNKEIFSDQLSQNEPTTQEWDGVI